MKPHVIKITDDRLLQVVLGAALFASVAIPVGGSLDFWSPDASWSIPILVLALIAIVRTVALVPEIHTEMVAMVKSLGPMPEIHTDVMAMVKSLGPVPEIHSNVNYLREVADVKVQRLSNVADFYGNLTRAVHKAQSSLDLTHIRDAPPADFGSGAGTFFTDLVDWCAADGRSIRRIISVQSPAMFLWAKELAEETRDMPQFQVRVIDWALPAPAMNMAIIDAKVTYLALTGDTLERTSGLGIEDSEAAQYFTSYYNNLWRVAQPLGLWLNGNSTEGFTRVGAG